MLWECKSVYTVTYGDWTSLWGQKAGLQKNKPLHFRVMTGFSVKVRVMVKVSLQEMNVSQCNVP